MPLTSFGCPCCDEDVNVEYDYEPYEKSDNTGGDVTVLFALQTCQCYNDVSTMLTLARIAARAHLAEFDASLEHSDPRIP